MILLQAGQPHSMRPQLDPRTIGELLYFGGGFTLARIGNYLASQADKAVVGRWLGAQTLGSSTSLSTSWSLRLPSLWVRSSIGFCFPPWPWCSLSPHASLGRIAAPFRSVQCLHYP